MNDARNHASAPTATFDHRRLQAIVFLVVLPVVNVLLLTTFLLNLDLWKTRAALTAFLRIWLIFSLSFVLLRLIERYASSLLKEGFFWRQLLLHGVIITAMGWLAGPVLDLPSSVPRPSVRVMPRIFMLFEVAIYLGVVRVLKHQERAFATAESLREAELNVLRAQSNPHFLFNTLNLIAAEISRDPDNAKEVVFDLADLLRSNIKMAERRLTTLEEEMNLVGLYLNLQKQRFRDRLTFSMDIEAETKALEVPALLLQPVVENTVKWAVAPYASKANIRVRSSVSEDRLVIEFEDTGPAFDDAQVVEGNGFRILRRTLELNYPGQWSLRLRSTTEGGRLMLSLPRREGIRT